MLPTTAQKAQHFAKLRAIMVSGMPPAGMTTARDDRKEDKQSQPHVTIASKHDDSVQMMGAEWHGTKSIKVTTAAASCA